MIDDFECTTGKGPSAEVVNKEQFYMLLSPSKSHDKLMLL